MKLKVLRSSSSGNCYLLQGQKETLILEAGIHYKDILKGLEFNLSNVVGVLCSHSHKDHSKAAKDLIKNGIDVYLSGETAKELNLDGYRVHMIESLQQFKIGDFTILPFDLQHDVYNLGFLIQHEEMGKLFFMTDSYYCKYNFKGLNHVMIECNYAEDILNYNIENEIIPASLSSRIIKSHSSIDYVKSFLKNTDTSKLKEVVLMHLSGDNSDPKRFKSEVERITGKEVYIAEKGLELDLDLF